jgi:hypothetical protein
VKSFGLLLALLWLLAAATAFADSKDLTGQYELGEPHANWAFSLQVKQTGKHAEISFSAANADGSGAAPDGDGQGEIDAHGVLHITFSDSFGDEGTATLTPGKDAYHLVFNVTKVADPRTMRFYGDVPLHLISTAVDSSAK